MAKADQQSTKTVFVDADVHAIISKIQDALRDADALKREVSKGQAIRYAVQLAARELKIKL